MHRLSSGSSFVRASSPSPSVLNPSLNIGSRLPTRLFRKYRREYTLKRGEALSDRSTMTNPTTLLSFLENARFPDPPTETQGSAVTTGMSPLDISLVHDNWKAQRAIRDPTLVNNLCDTLAKILGQTPLPDDPALLRLRMSFSPELDAISRWQIPNACEADVRHTSMLPIMNSCLDAVHGSIRLC
jgi:hypothetical protein